MFRGLKLLRCENPLPPLDEAIEAPRDELARSNLYTEPRSEPLLRLLAEKLNVAERLIHINAGSELILRQIFDRLGQQTHLLRRDLQLVQIKCKVEFRDETSLCIRGSVHRVA